jgi:TonB family protein
LHRRRLSRLIRSSLRQLPDPIYSDEARAANLQGTVQVYVELDEQGVPDKIEVLQGLGFGLDVKALAAVKQWTFRPAVTDEGIPIRSALTAAVRFRLGDSPSWRITRAAYTVQAPLGPRVPRPNTKPILAHYEPPQAGVCAATGKIAEVQLSIDPEGVPHRVESSDALDDSPTLRAAFAAAETWRYTPAAFNGKPAASDAFLELECDPAVVPATVAPVTLLAGRDIPAPAVVSLSQPEYTVEAYSAGIEGVVQFVVGIDTNGKVTNVASMHLIGHGLDQTGMDALLRCRFRPPMKDGKPVMAIAKMQLRFRVGQEAVPKQQ